MATPLSEVEHDDWKGYRRVARRYDARAAALESDARDFRRKATRARLAAGYVRKPTAPVGDGNG